MGTRRTFLKTVGAAVGATAISPTWAFGQPGRPSPHNVVVFIDSAGDAASRGELVLVALLAGASTPLAHALRRTKKARTAAGHRAEEIKASQATERFKTYLYDRLAKLPAAPQGGGFEAYAVRATLAKLPQDRSNRGGEIYLEMLAALLEQCRLRRFRQVSVYLNKTTLQGMTHAQLLAAIRKRLQVWIWDGFAISGVPSWQHPGVQVADFVAHAVFKRNQKPAYLERLRAHVRQVSDLTALL